MARMPKGNHKRLVLIRPLQLQFFKDGIKTTERETAAIKYASYFCFNLCMFGGGSCLNFDKIRDTAPLNSKHPTAIFIFNY